MKPTCFFSLGLIMPALVFLCSGLVSADDASDKFGAGVMKSIGQRSPEQLQAMLEKPGFVKTLLKWKLMDAVDSTVIREFATTAFMKAFQNDPAWQQGFFGSGPIPDPAMALKNLAALCKKDSKILSNPVYKKLATATALEFARNRAAEKNPENSIWNEETMMERYGYFRSSHASGLLNPIFDTLDYWDMRILTGCGNSEWADPLSLKWQRDNVRLPAQNYTGACWQAPYRLNNEWGDSIHGRDYYIPFMGLFVGAKAQMTKEIGAVCGGLSHFGAYAAIANGVPAMTMGEPGHCAYAVRINEKDWTPAYSLSWERGCHWSFYGHKWSELILTQDTFADQQACRKALLAAWTGNMADKCGNKEQGRFFYQLALKLQPVNYAIWMEYLDREIKAGDLNAEQWQQISSRLMGGLSAKYPEIAWMLLSEKVYPVLMDKLSSSGAKMGELAKFNKSLTKMHPATWNFEASLDKQFSFLGGSYDVLLTMIDMVVETYLNSDDYGAPALAWCMKHASASPEMLDKFLAKVSGSSGQANEKTILSLAAEMILKAEKSSDLKTFQAAGKLVKDHLKPSLPSFEPFPGELLSSGGMLIPSSTSEHYGDPWKHWGVLETCGGNFHTNKDKPGVATVLLPRIGDVSGIVVISPRGGNAARGNGTVIEASVDGIAWTPVGKIENMTGVHRIPVNGPPVRAKFVRLTRPAENFFHLDAILVYGKKAS